MPTMTTQQKKVEEKLAIVDNSLQTALTALDAISDSDIRATSYANGSSLFKQLRAEINTAISFRRRINYFK